MTGELIETWCETGVDEIERSVKRSPAVQRPEEMRQNVEERLEALHSVADRVYARWVLGLRT